MYRKAVCAAKGRNASAVCRARRLAPDWRRLARPDLPDCLHHNVIFFKTQANKKRVGRAEAAL